MSSILSWFRSYIYKEKSAFEIMNEQIEDIKNNIEMIKEKNKKTKEKNEKTIKNLKLINIKLFKLRGLTEEFYNFCCYIVDDYSKYGFNCKTIKDLCPIMDLSEDKLVIIYNNMDKYNYSKVHTLYNRYLDFNRIVGEIKKNKKINGNKKLLDMKLYDTDDDCLPPINYYKYIFTKEDYKEECRNTFEYFYDNYCQGENRLTKDEFKIIYDNMDKSNMYWSKLKKPNYNDYKSMKKIILYKKKTNGNKELKDINLVNVTDSYYPRNIYEYVFK
jgi:hypothetical protein